MLERAKKYFCEIMQDCDGHPSSKRWVTFICLLLLVTAFLSNLFFGYKVDAFMFDAITYIVIAGVGISGAEKFARK
jgi:hypothetical protein